MPIFVEFVKDNAPMSSIRNVITVYCCLCKAKEVNPINPFPNDKF